MFSVTFETVTPESAEVADVAERGFIGHFGRLRDAVEAFNRERDWTYIEPSCWPIDAGCWFTDIGEAAFASGEVRSVALHIPRNATLATTKRIARLLGVH